MKELNIEEKARKYDEAKYIMKEYLESGNAGVIAENTIKKAFPELAESEDERIRKEIISFLKSPFVNEYIADERMTPWIAWLEKQGNANKEYWRGYREGKQEILDKYAELEKQGEQKPVDKVEPKFKVKYAGSEYNVLEVKDIAGVTFYGIEDEPNHIDYVLPDNCEIVSEQKSTWSEEDEEMFNEIIIDLKALKNRNTGEAGKAAYQREIDWLKSLKPQNNITDKELINARNEAYNDALDKIEYNSDEPTFNDGWSAAIWYLKKRNVLH